MMSTTNYTELSFCPLLAGFVWSFLTAVTFVHNFITLEVYPKPWEEGGGGGGGGRGTGDGGKS